MLYSMWQKRKLSMIAQKMQARRNAVDRCIFKAKDRRTLRKPKVKRVKHVQMIVDPMEVCYKMELLSIKDGGGKKLAQQDKDA